MILTTIMLIVIFGLLSLLYLQFEKTQNFPLDTLICTYDIHNLRYQINKSNRIARFSICPKNINDHIYFDYFPIGFKFYSVSNFNANIKISYTQPLTDNIDVIYNNCVEFNDHKKEHIYYINDIIVGYIDIEIDTESLCGIPQIEFEILQNTKCYMQVPHKLQIKFLK